MMDPKDGPAVDQQQDIIMLGIFVQITANNTI